MLFMLERHIPNAVYRHFLDAEWKFYKSHFPVYQSEYPVRLSTIRPAEINGKVWIKVMKFDI